MDIVIDSSVIIAVVANEPGEPALVESTRGHTLIAPSSVHHEIGNAFSGMFKRRRATLDQVLGALVRYSAIRLRFVEVDLESSLRIAHNLDIYAYDAYLIDSAQRHQSPLLTLDRRLRERARAYGVRVIEVEL